MHLVTLRYDVYIKTLGTEWHNQVKGEIRRMLGYIYHMPFILHVHVLWNRIVWRENVIFSLLPNLLYPYKPSVLFMEHMQNSAELNQTP